MGVARRSAWLGAAQAVEIALQVVLPVLLVRHLAVDAFANYRLVWLIANTAATVLPFAVPNVLSLLLPPATAVDRRAHVALTLVFVGCCGLLGGALTAAGLLMGLPHAGLEAVALLCALFVALWVAGTALDQLPVADERGDWQAKATIGLAVFRAAAAAGVALIWQELSPLLWAMCAAAGTRVVVLLYYAQSRHQISRAVITRTHWVRQLRMAAPLGVAALLFGLRRQGDLWIAATLFSVLQFAAFSLGTVLSPVVFMIRRAISATLLPTMARQHGKGDWASVMEMNHRANTAVACIAVPVLSFVWCFGEPLYAMVYTEAFPQAVPVMRVLALGWLVQVVEFNSLIMLAGQMSYVARINGFLLVLSLLVAVAGGMILGLTGVALGSVIAILIERALVVRRLSQTLSLPVPAVQPWGLLLRISALGISLGVAGRIVFELFGPSASPLLMLLIAPVLLLVYVWVVGRRGWWPRKLTDSAD